jgi:ABC-2 type transport system ATP-binding protein
MASQAVLSLQDVTIRYGGRVAVDAVCLEVRRGEVYGLLGPNGSGKSTTLAAVVGAVPLAAGEVRVAGRCEAEAPLEYRRRVGLVPQELALYEELTAEQNLAFFGGLYGLRGAALKRRIAEVLAFVRLTEDARQRARTFSGGMQRRLNLACALLHEPELLLLDEPTVGLDVQSRDAIFASLRDLRDRGAALVFTTHHLEEAELLCDRLAIMDRGRLIAEGTLAELCDDLPPHPRPLSPASGARGARARGLERVFLELTGGGPSER